MNAIRNSPGPRFRRRQAGSFLAGTIVVAIGVTAWTWKATPVPPGYLLGCVVMALVLGAAPRWPAGVLGGVVYGAVIGLGLMFLNGRFYGAVPLVSVATLQSVAVWVVAMAAAGLLGAGLRVVRQRRGMTGSEE